MIKTAVAMMIMITGRRRWLWRRQQRRRRWHDDDGYDWFEGTYASEKYRFV